MPVCYLVAPLWIINPGIPGLNKNAIHIEATDCRGAEVEPFSAIFSYNQVEGTQELRTALFYGLPQEKNAGAAGKAVYKQFIFNLSNYCFRG